MSAKSGYLKNLVPELTEEQPSIADKTHISKDKDDLLGPAHVKDSAY